MDGPITANNPMGVHHAWGRTYKDLFQRYKTMRGFRQRYQNGFDCQGLWVEVEVEKELGFTSKRDIETFGIAPFVNLCKERVLTYAAVQTAQSMRLGMWMDWNNPDDLRALAAAMKSDPSQIVTYPARGGAVRQRAEQVVGRLGDPEIGGSYFTFSNENNYQIWGFLKRCWERGMIYKGHDVMPWCPRCSTGMSEQEIDVAGADSVEGTYVIQFAAAAGDKPEAMESIKQWYQSQGKPQPQYYNTIYYARGVAIGTMIHAGIASSPEPVTGENIKKGLESLKEFNGFGMLSPTTLTSDDHAGGRKVRIYQAQKGQLVRVQDWFEGPAS